MGAVFPGSERAFFALGAKVHDLENPPARRTDTQYRFGRSLEARPAELWKGEKRCNPLCAALA